jgi:hypothetical protein
MDKPPSFGEKATMSEGYATEKAENASTISRLRALLREAKAEMKQNGLRGLFRRFGWKFFAAIFIYYLVRDVTLYILLPWYIAKNLTASSG